MAYERYGRGDDEYRRDEGREGGYYGAGERGGYDRDEAGGRGGYGRGGFQGGYGQGSGGRGGYGQGGFAQGKNSRGGEGRQDYGQRDYGEYDYGQRDYGAPDYGQRDYGQRDYGQRQERGQERGRERFTGGDNYYRPSQGSDYRGRGQQGQGGDRGFFERAGDEVRSWFGDEQAERRREQDARAAERADRARDAHYHDWRDQQIASFDRDYDEYRQENRQKFHNEFSSWRTERQGQRDLLGKLKEHIEVVGSDGEHVGTVDKVRGDRVILTKSDPDAGGRHHSFPSRWLRSVDDKATLTKTAAEAKQHWQDEERQGAMFGGGQQSDDNGQTAGQTGGTDLNRSFSGTY